jgi:hypothetical protein
MRLSLCVLVVATTATVALPLAAASTVSDASRGFSFTLPDGYVEDPGGAREIEKFAGTLGLKNSGVRREPRLGRIFVRGQMGEPGFANLLLTSLGVTFDQDELDRSRVEEGARRAAQGSGADLRFEYRHTPWQGLELDLIVTRMRQEGHSTVSVGTQVPLAKEAIALTLSGAADEEASLLADLQAILGSLQGKSNWLTDAERSYRIGLIVGTVASAGGGAVLILVLLRRRRRTVATPSSSSC